jgi:DNA-binding NarL/FixJ family response regulator
VGDRPADQLLQEGGELNLESVLDLVVNHELTRGRGARGLTARQRQIAILVAEGFSNKEIGRRLEISERTVEAHLVQMRSRVNARSRAQLAALVTQEPPTGN